MTVRPINLLLGVGLLLAVPLTAAAQEQEQEQAQETLADRYQGTIDTVIARLQLGDSAGQQFRLSVGQYLAETEKIFAAHQGNADRASISASPNHHGRLAPTDQGSGFRFGAVRTGLSGNVRG